MNVLQCTDQPLNLIGNFNTGTAQLILIMFEKCDSTKRKTCKSNAEVREWMKNKYIILVYNRQLFQSEKFGDETFSRHSFLDWNPMNAETIEMKRYSIQIQTLTSQDQYWLSPAEEYKYYNFQQKQSLSYYFNSNMLNGIKASLME